jgi:hypothetical protein
MKKPHFFAIFILFLLTSTVLSQSPNAQSSATKIDASQMQTRSERGQSGGYVPLGVYAAPSSGPQPLIDPRYIFPNFTSAPNNTIWVKQGSSFVPLSGVSISSGSIVSSNVFVGQLDTNVNGVKIASGAGPLFLRGGSGNSVMVDNGQTIGGANPARNAFQWFIGPSGGFKLLSGEFNGAIDMNSFNLTEVGVASGAALSINFGTPGITSTSGNITMVAPGGAGVVIPSTASANNATFALNVTSANALYGRKDLTNTWSQVQTFSAAPVVPDGSFSVAKVNALQSALDLALKKDGSNSATGNLNAGGFKVTNMGAPTVSSDAVTLGYLTSNYEEDAITTIAAAGGTPVSVSTAGSTATLTIPAATALADGYLKASDWSIFNGKASAFSAVAPLFLVAGELSIALSDDNTSGYLSAADHLRFSRASAGTAWTDGQILIGQTSTSGAIKTTLTGGSNITVTNGPGSITIAYTPSGISGARSSALLNSSTSQSNVTTTTQTSMYSYTLPANSLTAGDVITIRASGSLILEASPQTITFTFTVGGTSVLSISFPGAGFSYSSSEVPYVLMISMAVRTTGPTGTAVYSAALSAQNQTILAQSGSTSLNTTVSRLLNVLMQISAVTGSNHISVENGTTRLN